MVGTVPVEADGSVQFEAPAEALLYFQALDAQGRAVQTMRSGTYLQPGAKVTCLGCHEPKHQSPPLNPQAPLALRQPVRQLKAGPSGSNPVFYPALVQTVLDRQCVSCHAKERRAAAPGSKKLPPDFSPTPTTGHASGKGMDVDVCNILPDALYKEKTPDVFYNGNGSVTRWTISYHSLVMYTGRNFGSNADFKPGGVGKKYEYSSRTMPGTFGALDSRLYPLLANGKHHGVKLSAEDMERLVIWMDLNSNFLGHYLFTDEQSRGILPMLPPTNYFDTSDHPEARIPITAKRKAN
jgi:mono/diheme cytochrome c family protein